MESTPFFQVGDRCFSHYAMNLAKGISGWGTVAEIGTTYRGQKHGVTGDPLPDTTWYYVTLDEGGRELLDDAHGKWLMARIVPPAVATSFGWGTDPKGT